VLYKNIVEAAEEAKRFLTKYMEYLAVHGVNDSPYASKEGGALKRASLDLTRALSKMRQQTPWNVKRSQREG